jgi:hypothetical protein
VKGGGLDWCDEKLTLIFCHILFCISTLVIRCLMSLPCVWMMSSMHEAADLVDVQGLGFLVFLGFQSFRV